MNNSLHLTWFPEALDLEVGKMAEGVQKIQTSIYKTSMPWGWVYIYIYLSEAQHSDSRCRVKYVPYTKHACTEAYTHTHQQKCHNWVPMCWADVLTCDGHRGWQVKHKYEIRGHHPPPHKTGRLPQTLTTSGVLLSSYPDMPRTWDDMVKILMGLLPWILGEFYASFLTHDPFSFFSDYDLWHSPAPLWGW